MRVRKSPRKRASFSKATPGCPANRSEFSRALAAPGNSEKPLDFSGFCPVLGRSRIGTRSEPLGAAPVRPAIPVIPVPVVAAIAVEVAVAAHSAARGAASLPSRRTGGPYGSARQAGASGRRPASCRAGRPHRRSSSWRPRWPPCCRRGRAGASPDRPASAGWNRHASEFIRALARSIRSLANSLTAVSTGGHSFSWSAVSLRPA